MQTHPAWHVGPEDRVQFLKDTSSRVDGAGGHGMEGEKLPRDVMLESGEERGEHFRL